MTTLLGEFKSITEALNAAGIEWQKAGSGRYRKAEGII
jgi:hypothetical protein